MTRPALVPLAVLAVLTLAPAAGRALAQGYGPGDVYANIPPIDDRGRRQIPMFYAWNPDPLGNHERQLASVQPELAAVVRRALAENPGLRFVVGSGTRSWQQQRQAEEWGWSPRTHPFAASPSLRKHLEGRAVDLWPLDENQRITFAPAAQGRIATAMLRAARELRVPISWGGGWRRKKDPTHFELR